MRYYNSGLGIRAATRAFDATGEEKYLRVASASANGVRERNLLSEPVSYAGAALLKGIFAYDVAMAARGAAGRGKEAERAASEEEGVDLDSACSLLSRVASKQRGPSFSGDWSPPSGPTSSASSSTSHSSDAFYDAAGGARGILPCPVTPPPTPDSAPSCKGYEGASSQVSGVSLLLAEEACSHRETK